MDKTAEGAEILVILATWPVRVKTMLFGIEFFCTTFFNAEIAFCFSADRKSSRLGIVAALGRRGPARRKWLKGVSPL